MAPSAPLVALKGAGLRFGRQQLFEDLAFGLGRGEHACLVGRNGTGKSSLLKVLAGLQDLDAGERFVQPGTKVAYLPQDPRLPSGVTVADFVAGDGEDGPARHQVDAVLKRLALDGARDVSQLSGGEGRRASLAKALVGDPDVLLLDEPTNHLDLPTIEWLETELSGFLGALLVISHDRTFLSKVSRATYWLDRGHLRHLDKSFAAFEDWADAIMTREAQAQHRLDRQIVREERWLHKGITARRKRNQGRLARLQEMRAARRAWLAAPGRVQVTAGQGARSGDRVIEAEGLSKTYPGPDGGSVTAVRDFSTRIRRGDRIGVIGPNGAGKTTLVRMLIGALAPDQGEVTLGHKVEPLYFDQTRESLDRAATLWQTLVPGGGDSLLVQGRQRHVVSYLRDFLFDESQARQPVKSLSGGERNRLLLARLFAQPGNLLVMDEPTNDLDLETAELLVDILAQFDGTVLLVSHDRDFLDRSVTGLFVFTGEGRIEDHVGGYSDYLARRSAGPEKPETPAVAGPKPKSEKPKRTGAAKLSYKEQHELAGLPAEIDRLTAEVERLEAALADPELYARDPEGFTRASNGLAAARQALHTAEDRWLELEARRESLRAGPEPATKTEESRAPASRA